MRAANEIHLNFLCLDFRRRRENLIYQFPHMYCTLSISESVLIFITYSYRRKATQRLQSLSQSAVTFLQSLSQSAVTFLQSLTSRAITSPNRIADLSRNVALFLAVGFLAALLVVVDSLGDSRIVGFKGQGGTD